MQTQPRLPVLIEKLHSFGFRLTPQRMAILSILAESEAHPTVEDVFDQVRVNFPMTSLATVYKTVAMLKEVGEIHELSFGAGSSRYDASKPQPHPHLICTGCQKILDPDIELLADVSHKLEEKYGYQITNQRMDFFGLCPECQQKRISSMKIG